MTQDTASAATPVGSILHPTDFSAASEIAFAHALKIALAAKTHFYIVHTEPPETEIVDWTAFPGIRSTLERWGLIDAGSPPEAVGERLGVRVRKVDVFDKRPVHGVIRFLNDHPCDLIVLGTHGRAGMQRWLSGSTAEPLAREAHLPALFLHEGVRGFVDPAGGDVRLRRVLVPIDHSPRPEPAISAAWQLARLLGCDAPGLLLLHVGDPARAPTLELPPGIESHVELLTRQGSVVDTILAAAREDDVDLIAMATHGHEGFLDALRGSTTEQVVRRADRPVLAVPAP